MFDRDDEKETDPSAGLLPAGLRDVLPPRAEFEASVTDRLMAGFARQGYRRVKPPLLEFEDTLLAGAGKALQGQMFRLMDPVSHRMMGLRNDITMQVARIAVSRLKIESRPLRLSYAGQVLRVRGTQVRPERQFGQCGVELIGTRALAADAEVMLMAAEELMALGVEELSIDITHPRLVPTVCEGLGMDPVHAEGSRKALDRKDAVGLKDVAGDHAPLLLKLMQAAGPAEYALNALAKVDLPDEARALVDEIAELTNTLKSAAPMLTVTIDPSEFRGFEYHSGICFALFARGMHVELGRGGRYLAEAATGAMEPATGFTIYLDALMKALPTPDDPPTVFVPYGTPRARAVGFRAEGWTTVQGLEKVYDARTEARRLGCSHCFENDRIDPV